MFVGKQKTLGYFRWLTSWQAIAALLLSFVGLTIAEEEIRKFYPELEILGATNRPALSYQPGEEMVFTFQLNNTQEIPGDWQLRYTRRGDDGKTVSGKAPATGTLTVKTSLAQPGFVFIEVFLADAKARPIQRDANKSNRIAFYAGSAVQPEQLSDCGEPENFDAFWTRQKQRLAAVPFLEQTECTLVKTVKNGKVYALSIPCAGPRPATGYLVVPDGAAEKSLAARIEFYGYGARQQAMPSVVMDGHLVLKLNAHGQELGRDAEYYKQFFQSIRSEKYSYAMDPEENKDAENCFFNGMVLRLLRAMEYLKSRPEWNGKDLIAVGGSQGGLQTIWAAALDQDVSLALPSIIWCCDLAGATKAKRLDGGWRVQYVPALDYFDPVFMAKRIKSAKVVIERGGLGDYVCPPSGLAICYKNLATPRKSIRWVQGSNHNFVPKESDVIVWDGEMNR